MAAFYALPDGLFHSFAGLVGRLRGNRLYVFRRLLGIHSEFEKIVHGMPEILFAAEIVFGGLDGCMTE